MEQLFREQSKNKWQFNYVCEYETSPPSNEQDYFNLYYNHQLAQHLPNNHQPQKMDLTQTTFIEVKVTVHNPEEQSLDQEWTEPKSSLKAQRKRRRRAPKQPYPTKNFLPLFKPHILNYIKTYYKNYHLHPELRRIQHKNSINLQDYEVLFNTPEFRDILAVYFSSKKIYRDLFQSRIDFARKQLYFKKVHVFQQAFLSGKFQNINGTNCYKQQ